MKVTCALVLALTSVAVAQSGTTQTDAQRCERVAQLKVADTAIAASLVSAGAFQAPGDPPPAAIVERYKIGRASCRERV